METGLGGPGCRRATLTARLFTAADRQGGGPEGLQPWPARRVTSGSHPLHSTRPAGGVGKGGRNAEDRQPGKPRPF